MSPPSRHDRPLRSPDHDRSPSPSGCRAGAGHSLPPSGGAGGGPSYPRRDHSLPPSGRRVGGGLSYPSRDYLCLDCSVPGDCDPASVICLWRTDRRPDGDEGELELLCAVEQLAVRRPAAVADVACLLGIAPSALEPTIRRAVEAGLLAQREPNPGGPPGMQLTARGGQRLAELRDAEPELELSTAQRACYHVLANVRDLQDTGRATDALLARLMGRRNRNVAANLRRLAALELVDYHLGQIELTDAGHRLLVTLRAYAINLRPGPRLLIRARGTYRAQALGRADPAAWTCPSAPAPHHTRRS
jgi:DNA-binding MarR family transcriptional regulator